jgi:hypothetical protein
MITIGVLLISYLIIQLLLNKSNIYIFDFDNIATEFAYYAAERKDPSPNFKIPYSCFWETSKLNDDYFYFHKIDIVSKLLLIQNYKIRELSATKTYHERNCSQFENILLSRISQNGIENICKALFINFNYFVNSKQFLSLASVSETDTSLNNIDLKNTVDFNYFKRFFTKILNKLLGFIKKISNLISHNEMKEILSHSENVLISPIGLQFKYNFFLLNIYMIVN